jgi:hypothetical protein
MHLTVRGAGDSLPTASPPSYSVWPARRLVPACRSGTLLLTAGYVRMRQNPYDWPQVGGSVVVWLVIGVVAGVGLLALLDPGSVDVLIATEL